MAPFPLMITSFCPLQFKTPGYQSISIPAALVGITGIFASSVVPFKTAPSSKWNSIPLFKNNGAVR